MIAVDTNILIYAHRADVGFHSAARGVMAELHAGQARWAIPMPCVHEFLGNVTNPRAFKVPTPMSAALGQVRAWMKSPSLVLLGEADDHVDVLEMLLTTSKVVGPKVHDARIAAICISHGVDELWTLDRDFGRFVGITTRNPFAPPPV